MIPEKMHFICEHKAHPDSKQVFFGFSAGLGAPEVFMDLGTVPGHFILGQPLKEKRLVLCLNFDGKIIQRGILRENLLIAGVTYQICKIYVYLSDITLVFMQAWQSRHEITLIFLR